MNIRFNKKQLACLTLALILFNSAGCKNGKDKRDEVIIKVNERAVTAGEYKDSLSRLLPAEQNQSREELIELKKELVNEIIEEELLLEEALRSGIAVTASELSSEVDLIRKEYGEDSFKEAIAERYGSLEGWEERIERKLVLRKTIDRITGSAVKVKEGEARKYYFQNEDEFKMPDQVRARMIVASTEEAARDIKQRLTPKNFAEVAKEVSLSPEGKDGGDLGWFAVGEMPGEFEEVVFSLKPDEISNVIKTEYGYHIFLLEGKRKGGKAGYAEARSRIMERLKNEKAALELENWIEAAKKNSKIEVREDLL